MLKNASMITALIKTIIAAVGTKEVQSVLQLIMDFVKRQSPPPPSPTSDGETPPVTPEVQKRLLQRIVDRIRIAMMLTDKEVTDVAVSFGIETEDYLA
jgi:hypothetical protein